MVVHHRGFQWRRQVRLCDDRKCEPLRLSQQRRWHVHAAVHGARHHVRFATQCGLGNHYGRFQRRREDRLRIGRQHQPLCLPQQRRWKFHAAIQRFRKHLRLSTNCQLVDHQRRFNGDGKSDYAMIGSVNRYAYLSNGDGTFTLQFSAITNTFGYPPTNSWAMVTGDFNGDGKSDYALVGSTNRYVYLSNGDGNFTLQYSDVPNTFGSPPTA